MTSDSLETAHRPVQGPTERRPLLPPLIVMLVFAMVVVAVGGFAYLSREQQSISALRLEASALREAVTALERTNASAARVLNGERSAVVDFFHDLESLKGAQQGTLAGLEGGWEALAALDRDWNDATSLAADNRYEEARGVLSSRGSDLLVTRLETTATTALENADRELAFHEDQVRLGTMVILVLQVLSGTLAMSGMFFAFRSSAREADGRSAALKSADTSREQVARLFEMADVLQSAADYGDANQVLKATAS
ncbi:MAG: hypothetical protein ABI697_03480, partial [Devosia sp.]